MRQIVWSPLAVSRVEDAARFIAEDSPEAGGRSAEGAFDAVGRLARFPRSGSVVPELDRDDVRELIYGEYRIIYRVESERILVLTVGHGRRLLDDEEVGGNPDGD